MSPVVRVVGIADGDGDGVRARAAHLPDGIEATIVATRGGLLVTLARRYGRYPGGRRRAVRDLQAELGRVIGR